MFSVAVKRYLLAAIGLSLALIASPRAFAAETVFLSSDAVHVSVITPMQRRVYKLEVNMRGAVMLDSGQRYYVSFEFPNGYQFSECVMGKSLNNCERLTILLPHYRISQGGLTLGSPLEVTINADSTRTTATSVSNRLTLYWNVADIGLRQLAIRDLSAPSRVATPVRARGNTTLVSTIRRLDVGSDGSDLADQVAEVLRQMAGTDGISVSSQGQEVRITGTVGSEAQRQLILNAVRALPNVEVNDQLTITAPIEPRDLPVEPRDPPESVNDIPAPTQKSSLGKHELIWESCGQEITCAPRCKLRARRRSCCAP